MGGRCQRVKEDNQSLLYTFMNLSRKKSIKKTMSDMDMKKIH